MLKARFTATALAAMLAFAPMSAQALTFNIIDDNGNTVNTGASDPGEMDVDINFINNQPVWLQVVLELSDINTNATLLALSGFYGNQTGVDWTDFHIELEPDGAAAPFPTPFFQEVNDFIPNNNGAFNIQLGNNDSTAWVFFNPAEPFGFQLGNPNDFIDPGQDWFINLNGLDAGESFLIHLAPSIGGGTGVPEPVSGVLGLMGLGVLSMATRRRVA